MAVYFQKIADSHFDAGSSFVVKESKRMRLFISMLILAVAAIMFQSSILLASVIAIFGLATLLASRKSKIVMTISKDGFFYYGQLVTNWKNFVSAEFVDQVPELSKSSLGISDQFYIAIRYNKGEDKTCYERKIALTNMQDKAEEEIMAAIRFYYKKSNEPV